MCKGEYEEEEQEIMDEFTFADKWPTSSNSSDEPFPREVTSENVTFVTQSPRKMNDVQAKKILKRASIVARKAKKKAKLKRQETDRMKKEQNKRRLGQGLYEACKEGNVTLAKSLIERGADISYIAASGATPLIAAVRHGHIECIQLLAEQGTDLSFPARNGGTPVYIAAGNGKLECLRFLAGYGADTRTPANNGATPVFIAAGKGELDCLRFLAATGGDLNAPTNTGTTPVHTAAQNGNVKCLEFLAEKKSESRDSK
jgi:ankyrin repeat protein